MHTHLHKWGNSLGLRIPAQMAKQLHLHPGTPITIEIKEGKLIIQNPKYDLESLLKNITDKNKHDQLLDDSQKGNEEW